MGDVYDFMRFLAFFSIICCRRCSVVNRHLASGVVEEWGTYRTDVRNQRAEIVEIVMEPPS